MWHKVRVDLGRVGSQCRIWLDDNDISDCVRGIVIDAHVDRLSVVKLELTCVTEVHGEAGVLAITKGKGPIRANRPD